MKHLGVIVIGCGLLSGCASWFGSDDQQAGEAMDNAAAPEMQVVNIRSKQIDNEDAREMALEQFYKGQSGVSDSYGSLAGQPHYANGKSAYNGRMLTKHVGDYVQNMAQDLVSNMEYVTDKTPIGITTFALIDSDLQQTNLLGYQLAESFVHELHKFRIPVIDFKATDYIRVTDAGDFILTRDFLELSSSAKIDYILTGTMTKHQGGYLVNARILGLETKAVVATSQMLLPFYVVDALLPSDQSMMDGVTLTQGE